MLDGAANPTGQIDVGGDARTRLADLLGVWSPPERGDDSGNAQCPAQPVREGDDRLEPVLAADAATGADDDASRRQLGGVAAGPGLDTRDAGTEVLGIDGRGVGAKFRFARGVGWGRLQAVASDV